jgi:uncharacterized protein (TIGR02996 family)
MLVNYGLGVLDAIRESPADAINWLALADILEEQGRDEEAGRAREMTGMLSGPDAKMPERQGPFFWWARDCAPHNKMPLCNRIPAWLWDYLNDFTGRLNIGAYWGAYNDEAEAIQALHGAAKLWSGRVITPPGGGG